MLLGIFLLGVSLVQEEEPFFLPGVKKNQKEVLINRDQLKHLPVALCGASQGLQQTGGNNVWSGEPLIKAAPYQGRFPGLWQLKFNIPGLYNNL